MITPSPEKSFTAESESISRSNSLTDLAARIRIEHTAVAEALKDSLKHAIVAGELLIEAKEKLQHGQWLPWLREHCTISERTAQLYMRAAKHRGELEANTQCVADLTLSEAAALLALSSGVRKLFRFVKELDGLDDPEAIINACVAANIPVIHDPSYSPFANKSDEENRDWLLFTAFLSFDSQAGRSGYKPQDAWCHVEWVLQRPFQNVAEWLGPEGEKFRKTCGMKAIPETFRDDWVAFHETHSALTFAEVDKKLDALQERYKEDDAAGRIERHPRRRQKRNALRI
jgi:DUF3102 family protein